MKTIHYVLAILLAATVSFAAAPTETFLQYMQSKPQSNKAQLNALHILGSQNGIVVQHAYSSIYRSINTKDIGAATVIDIRSKGAVGDNNTDDTANIQAVLNSAPVNAIIYIPKGFIFKAFNLSVSNANNITFTGGGCLKFKDGVSTGSLITFNNSSNIVIDGIEIDGNISGGSEGDRQLLGFVDTIGPCKNITVKNCYIHDSTAVTTASGSPGILANGSTDFKAINNKIFNTDVSIQLRRCTNVAITDNIMSGGASESISLWGDSSGTPNVNVSIKGNFCYKPLQLSSVTNASVISNTINTNLVIGGRSTSNYTFIASGVVVSNNTMTQRINLGSQNGTLTDITANDIDINHNIIYLYDQYILLGSYKSNKVNFSDNRIVLMQNSTNNLITDNGTDTNIILNNNTIDSNGFTLAGFVKLNAASFPVSVKFNTFLGSATSTDGIYIRATTGTGSEIIGNIMQSSHIRTNIAGIKIRSNVTNRARIETVASATTLAVYSDYTEEDSYYLVSGTTNITSITPTRANHYVTLVFNSANLTVTYGNNLLLQSDFVTTTRASITLLCDGTNWYEVGRTGGVVPSITASSLTATQTSSGASILPLVAANPADAANTEVEIKLQPSSSTARYSSISNLNDGSNQMTMRFKTGRAAAIYEKMNIGPTGTVQIGNTEPGYKTQLLVKAGTEASEATTNELFKVTQNDGTKVYAIAAAGHIANKIGANVASGGSITPTANIFHVTGTTTINTINVIYTGYTGCIKIIPDGAFATGISGNIALASTAVVNKMLEMCYDGTKWYPSY